MYLFPRILTACATCYPLPYVAYGVLLCVSKPHQRTADTGRAVRVLEVVPPLLEQQPAVVACTRSVDVTRFLLTLTMPTLPFPPPSLFPDFEEDAALVAMPCKYLPSPTGNRVCPWRPRQAHDEPPLLVLLALRKAVVDAVVVSWKALVRPRFPTTDSMARAADEAAAVRLMPPNSRNRLVICRDKLSGSTAHSTGLRCSG